MSSGTSTPSAKLSSAAPMFPLRNAAASSVIGPIIPPSIIMVLYALVMNVSVGFRPDTEILFRTAGEIELMLFLEHRCLHDGAGVAAVSTFDCL